MCHLINSRKLLSENPQLPPPEKIHSPLFTHSPLKIQKVQVPPSFLATLKNFQPPPSPAERGGAGRTLCHPYELFTFQY